MAVRVLLRLQAAQRAAMRTAPVVLAACPTAVPVRQVRPVVWPSMAALLAVMAAVAAVPAAEQPPAQEQAVPRVPGDWLPARQAVVAAMGRVAVKAVPVVQAASLGVAPVVLVAQAVRRPAEPAAWSVLPAAVRAEPRARQLARAAATAEQPVQLPVARVLWAGQAVRQALAACQVPPVVLPLALRHPRRAQRVAPPPAAARARAIPPRMAPAAPSH